MRKPRPAATRTFRSASSVKSVRAGSRPNLLTARSKIRGSGLATISRPETTTSAKAPTTVVLRSATWKVSAETFHVALRKTTVVGALADVVVSGREMVAKPDPRIFDLAVSRFGLDPARTLFTDDAERNVRVAAGRGFRTHHFQGPAGLRAQLRALGVDVPVEAAT